MTEEQKELRKDLCQRLDKGICFATDSGRIKKLHHEGFFFFFKKSVQGGMRTHRHPLSWTQVNQGVMKPILRSLDDVTNLITQDGKTFVPIDVLTNEVGHSVDYNGGNWREAREDGEMHYTEFKWLPVCVVNWLIEHHFDINGLIKKGRAINVNDLKEDCYA